MRNNLLDDLEMTTARVPERTAFYDDRETLSFAALQEKAQRIGSALAAVSEPRTPVALLIDARSIRTIPALYGVLYAGCAYAPLDVALPPDRLSLLLDRLTPSAILADEAGEKALQGAEPAGVPVLRFEEAAAAACNPEKLAQIRAGARLTDPASILYTSGSTGIPKGSIQTQASYLQWTEATIRMYSFDENVIFGNQSPFFYANSVIDIFPPVALGAKVYLLPGGALTFPKLMVECLNAQHVTELTMTPFSFINVVNAGVLEPGCVPSLRWGIMSGESMPWPPLKVWMDATPAADWWHFYGSTEMFSVAVGKVAGEPPAGERIPVGRPFREVSMRFVDEDLDDVPPGTPGEMLVRSPWVTVGYHRDEVLTEASRVTDDAGNAWFRAGDLGYLREDGQLIVLGRRDAQIKHMGFRMELGEVEAALRILEGWQDGCVLHDKERDRIWCFYTGSLTETELRRDLKEKLAKYMIPDEFVHLEEMPHTPSMKLDRRALTARMKEGSARS